MLDFCLGQRGLTIQTPVHRLAPLIKMTALEYFSQGADNIRLGLVVHGEIGIVPITQHTQTNKILFLSLDLLGGVFAAQIAKASGRHLLAMLFFHLQFNRKTMTIPAGHIRRIEAG